MAVNVVMGVAANVGVVIREGVGIPAIQLPTLYMP